jgi:GNAT superfamily N-acetyltransferase
MQGVQIREFEPGDQSAARKLILEGLGEHFGYIDEACNPDLDDIMAYYIVPGHIFLVATLGENLVGTGGLVLQDESCARIVRVSVRRDSRRRGIGRALVMRFIAVGRERQVARIWVETNEDWHAAINLYHRCGFREYERQDGCVYMELNLSRDSDSAVA